MSETATKLTVMRNPAEEGFLKIYAEAAGSLPGTKKITEARRAAMARFEELGLPHRRIEEWKYTDLRARITEAFPVATGGDVSASAIDAALGALAGIDAVRLVLVDGRYSQNHSNADMASEGLTIKSLAEALADDCFADMHATIANVPDSDPTVALNTGLMSDGVAIHVTGKHAKPLHIVQVMTAANPGLVTTRNIVSIGNEADVTLLDSFVSLGDAATQVNTLTHIGVGDDARVCHVQTQQENAATTHLATWAVDLAARCHYQALQVTTGGALTRNQIYLTFNGEDAKAHINGAWMQRGEQHCDSTLVIDHIVPGCESREVFKGVLDDKARGIFQGKIMVKPEAQKTDGKQMAQALLLSEDAEFDSKPELEIFADDVVCGHGSTSGAIDEDLLFYLRARGIPEKKARALLVQAFVGEAIEIVEDNDALYGALMSIAEDWLSEAA
ncbi:MAG: Fe-S cluster assembly protein SufD [Hyphomicrobiaceae bacterium]